MVPTSADNSEVIAQKNLAAEGLDPKVDPEEYREAWPVALKDAEEAVKAEREEVRELGGLYVLGSERHESRRIDNQLRGRSGRQGDPGESRFYLSMEDDLMRLFNSGMAQRIMRRAPTRRTCRWRIAWCRARSRRPSTRWRPATRDP